MTSVLVSGVGGVVGYGVVRSLRRGRPDVRIVGTDIHVDAVGAHWCDEFVPAPRSVDDRFPDWLMAAVQRHHIDLVYPTLDADLDRYLATPDLVERLPCPVVLNSRQSLILSRDKWALDRHLLRHGDPARIPSSDIADFATLRDTLGVPFLLKPRHGYGSRGQIRIDSEVQFRRHSHRIPSELFAQKIVGTDDQEYTVGVFGAGDGGLHARIVMRRWLAPEGMTRRVEVLVDPPESFDATLTRLATISHPLGPTNWQFRRTDDTWHLLEINARTSSSSSLRCRFGYHEAVMAAGYYLDGTVPEQPVILAGSAARYVEDVVLDDRLHL